MIHQKTNYARNMLNHEKEKLEAHLKKPLKFRSKTRDQIVENQLNDIVAVLNEIDKQP